MKKYNLSLVILTFLICIFPLQNLSTVYGLTATITDPQDDVIIFTWAAPTGIGDYHDEIDIVSLRIAGQNIDLIFAGNVEAGSNPDIVKWHKIFFYETYDPEVNPLNQTRYSVEYTNWYPSSPMNYTYRISFIKYEVNGIGIVTEFWTGSVFDSNSYNAISIGGVSGNKISAQIPVDAWIVPDNLTYFAESSFSPWVLNETNNHHFVDFCPDEFYYYEELEIPGNGNGGPAIIGYNLFIFIGVMVGISMIFLKKKININ